MTMEPSRTHHANQAVQLGDLVALKFSDQRFGTSQPRILKVSNPDGPSTDGGLKARQSILLVAENADTTAGAIVLGWLDTPRRAAELRPYASVNQAQQQRYGHGLDISKVEYDRCINDLHEFFRAQGIDSRVQVAQNSTRRSIPVSAPEGSATSHLLVGLVCLGIGFAVCYGLFVAGVLSL